VIRRGSLEEGVEEGTVRSGGCSYGDAAAVSIGRTQGSPLPQRREFDHGACRGAQPSAFSFSSPFPKGD